MQLSYEYRGNIYNVNVEKREDRFYIVYDESEYTVDASMLKEGELKIALGDTILKCVVASKNDSRYVFVDGDVFKVKHCTHATKRKKGAESEDSLASPISGTVVEVKVKKNDKVKKGEVLLVIEAMKMEYLIRAPFDGKVGKVHFKKSDQIEIGAQTVELIK